MEPKEKVNWLFRYRDSLREQKRLELEAQQLQAYAERVSPRFIGRPGGQATESRFPETVEKLIRAHDDLRAQINCCIAARAEVLAVIEGIADQRQRDILRRRYILGQTYETIAEEMRLDLRWVYRLHRRAVAALAIPEPGSAAGDPAGVAKDAPPGLEV